LENVFLELVPSRKVVTEQSFSTDSLESISRFKRKHGERKKERGARQRGTFFWQVKGEGTHFRWPWFGLLTSFVLLSSFLFFFFSFFPFFSYVYLFFVFFFLISLLQFV